LQTDFAFMTPMVAGAAPESRESDALMRKVVCRVGLSGADVLRCEVGVVVKDVFNAVACSEAAQNVLDADSCADDHGLPQHDLRIAFNARVLHGVPPRVDRISYVPRRVSPGCDGGHQGEPNLSPLSSPLTPLITSRGR